MAIVVTQQPVFQVALVGDTATFVAAATGATGVYWVKDGATISGTNSSTYTTPALAVTGYNGSEYNAVYTNGVNTPVATTAVPLWVVAPYIAEGNGYGSGNYGVQRYKYEGRSTDQEHYNALRKTFPVKALLEDTVFDSVLQLDGHHLDDAYDLGKALLREVHPDTAEQLIAGWERIHELPATGTLAVRQARAKAARAATGGLSRAYFIALAAAMGYTVTITEGSSLIFIVHSTKPPATALPAALFTPDVAWTWYVAVASVTEAPDLERLFEELKPAWTEVSFTYS